MSNNLRAKLVALKLLRYRSIAHAESKNALELFTPVLKMLAALLDHDGSMPGGDPAEQESVLVVSLDVLTETPFR